MENSFHVRVSNFQKSNIIMSKMGCWAHNAHNTLLTLNQDIDCKIKSLPKKFAPIFTTERLILMNNPKNTKQEKTYFNSQLIKAISH